MHRISLKHLIRRLPDLKISALRFQHDASGAIAPIVAVTFPAALMAIMVAVDVLRMYEAKRQLRYVAEQGCQAAAFLGESIGEDPSKRTKRINYGIRLMNSITNGEVKVNGVTKTGHTIGISDWITVTSQTVELHKEGQGGDTFVGSVEGSIKAIGMFIWGFDSLSVSTRDICSNITSPDQQKTGTIAFSETFNSYLNTTFDKLTGSMRDIEISKSSQLGNVWSGINKKNTVKLISFRNTADPNQTDRLHGLSLDSKTGNNSVRSKLELQMGTYELRVRFLSASSAGNPSFWNDKFNWKNDTQLCTSESLTSLNGHAVGNGAVAFCITSSSSDKNPTPIALFDRNRNPDEAFSMSYRFSVDTDGDYFLKLVGHGKSNGDGGIVDDIQVVRTSNKLYGDVPMVTR